MMSVTLDTGALIAMEKRKPRATMLLLAAKEQRVELFVTTPIVAEWWRGRSDRRDDIKRGVTIVPLPLQAAEATGLVLGEIRNARERVKLTIDVMVMAFAAIYGGGLVYTSDVEDFARLKGFFPSVRILSI
jgi:predicted nucleic acid-binding protein